ncbi:hypothetical protein [Siminovitchia sp. 179-K 8D1 HS]|uniref:hypothetical protein n=1 Tax=Siminovitchia sp. 179-K 8D1 HS TaxID=3142385 RepID=UPI0039A2BAA2
MKIMAICFMVLLFAGGCAQRLPEPESMKAKASEESQTQKTLTVHRNVKGNTLFIECFVPSISFSNQSGVKNKGKARLYMNGKFHSEHETAAFIVKDLPKGVHAIKIEIVNLNSEPVGLSEQFSVTIP